MNPIEEFFGAWKAKVDEYAEDDTAAGVDQIVQLLAKAFNEITIQEIRSIIRHVDTEMFNKIIAREDLV
jgi:hypothetical protein